MELHTMIPRYNGRAAEDHSSPEPALPAYPNNTINTSVSHHMFAKHIDHTTENTPSRPIGAQGVNYG